MKLFDKLLQFMKLKESNFLGTMNVSIEEYTKLKFNYTIRHIFYMAFFALGVFIGSSIIGLIIIIWVLKI